MWTFEHNTAAAPREQTRQSFTSLPKDSWNLNEINHKLKYNLQQSRGEVNFPVRIKASVKTFL